MSERYPSRRPMGPFRDEEVGYDYTLPPGAGQIPWIDIHQHGHTASWNDRHEFDLSGGIAVVLVGGSSGPYRPMDADELRYAWDSTLRQSHAISRSHFFEAYVALAIHTTRTRTERYEELLEVLPEYAALDEVVAIGETGVSLNNVGAAEAWSLSEQRTVVREQMRIARDAGLPVLCHTPSRMKSGGSEFVKSKTEGGHSYATPASGDDQLDPETAKLDATRIDVELADEAGLPHEQLVIDHAAPEIAPFVMESTDCYLSFSVGSAIHDIGIGEVAETISEYGPDRIVVDSDVTGMAENRPFAMKEAILDLLRYGLSPDTVRQVVYENPREIVGLSELPV